jgi:hypothetical protein
MFPYSSSNNQNHFNQIQCSKVSMSSNFVIQLENESVQGIKNFKDGEDVDTINI